MTLSRLRDEALSRLAIGVVELSRDSEGAEELLRMADDALYAAKRKGRDCVVVSGLQLT